jgi:hypothetical protein
VEGRSCFFIQFALFRCNFFLSLSSLLLVSSALPACVLGVQLLKLVEESVQAEVGPFGIPRQALHFRPPKLAWRWSVIPCVSTPSLSGSRCELAENQPTKDQDPKNSIGPRRFFSRHKHLCSSPLVCLQTRRCGHHIYTVAGHALYASAGVLGSEITTGQGPGSGSRAEVEVDGCGPS